MTFEGTWQLLVARVGWTLLHFLWQGTIIAFLYATTRSLSRSLSASARYWLALTALAALATAPVITFALNPRKGYGLATPFAASAALLPAAVALWLTGVLVLSTRLIGGLRLVGRLRAASSAASARWQRHLDDLAARLGVGAGARLFISPLVNVPLAIGCLRPVILVPIEFLTGMPPEHVSALLAHELAHVLRRDYVANVLQGIVETIFFYHPAVWRISNEVRIEREHCCDDLAANAVGDVVAYAQALAELETREPSRSRLALPASGGALVERVRRLIEPDALDTRAFPRPAAAWAMVLLWLAGAGIAVMHGVPPAFPARPVPQTFVSGASESTTVRRALPIAERRRMRLRHHDGPMISGEGGAGDSPVKSHESEPPPEVESAAAIGVAPVLDSPPAVPALLAGEATLATLSAEPGAESGSDRDDPPPAATFHAASRLVLVDVVLRGKRSQQAGLNPEDFELLDNGKPRRIALFAPASAGSAPSPQPLAAGAISNRIERNSAAPGNATVLLLDQRNTSQPDQVFVIHRVKRFIETRPAGGHSGRLAIYAYRPSGSLEVVQELTADNQRLRQAAGSLRVYTPSLADSPTEADRRVLETNEVLETIARHLGCVPGRKNLVWISSGFALAAARGGSRLDDFNPYTEQTARVLTDTNLAFYPVDARGLAGGLGANTAVPDAESPGPSSPFPLPSAILPAVWGPDRIEVFRRLADLTGGMAFHDNGIEDSIQRALDDAALDYTLGFYSPQNAPNPSWHKLKVKVNQRGLSLRYRAKYFAPGATVDDDRRAVPLLLRAPLDATQVQMVAQTAPDRLRPGFSQVQLSIDLHDLHLERQNDNWVGAVDVSFAFDGAPSARTIARDIRIANDGLAAALERGISLSDSIPVDNQKELHIVAQDRATGAAGSLTVPLSR